MMSKATGSQAKQSAGMATDELKKYREPERISVLSSFFKTDKGQYGEGDTFIGVTVPNIRIVAKIFADLPFTEIEILLMSRVHEHRSLAVYILAERCKALMKAKKLRAKESKAEHKRIFDFYLAHSQQVNNWDLVDASARDVVGGYLFYHEKMDNAIKILAKLAKTKSPADRPHMIWDRRIAMIATLYFISNGKGEGMSEPTLAIAEMLLGDKHDLMHKAVGWMLREMGKRDPKPLHAFLNSHAPSMPRTALRYAIERLPEAERARYMAMR